MAGKGFLADDQASGRFQGLMRRELYYGSHVWRWRASDGRSGNGLIH
jgi:hypothetical protein